MSQNNLLTNIPIVFDYPFEVDGQMKNGVNMRRPKLKDQLRYAKTDLTAGEKEVAMFADLCELSHEAMEELDLVDYEKMQEAFKRFLSSKKQTSDESASSSQSSQAVA